MTELRLVERKFKHNGRLAEVRATWGEGSNVGIVACYIDEPTAHNANSSEGRFIVKLSEIEGNFVPCK